MLPFIWEYRGRALLALGCLVLAKLANVGVHLVGTLKNPLHGIFQDGARKTRFPGAFIFKRLGA